MGAVANIAHRFFGDRLANYLTGIGTQRDKATGSYYTSSIMSPQQLEDAYRYAWLPRKIVDIPAKDACRNWRSWNAKPEQISAIETEERRLNLRGEVRTGMIRGRLYGGSAMMIGTGESALYRELIPDRIGRGGLKYVALIPRRYLTAGDLENDPASPNFMRPRWYTYGGLQGQQVQVHPSRLVMFQGNPLPDPEAGGGADYGWSDSVLTSAYTACVNADSTTANIASLVFEAKVDVFRIDDLAKWLENGATKLLERFRIANIGKGINGALLLDKNEEYEQKTINFASLPDVLREFMQIVSGAADIPVTRLLGQSPGGMNSTGESDLRNYYDLVQSMQKNDIEPGLRILDECLIRSALGERPAEVFYNWNSLWQVSANERSEIGKRTAETIKLLAETNLIPPEPLAAASVNMLVENGVMPGLEQEMADWVAGGGPDDDDDDASAAIKREGEGSEGNEGEGGE